MLELKIEVTNEVGTGELPPEVSDTTGMSPISAVSFLKPQICPASNWCRSKRGFRACKMGTLQRERKYYDELMFKNPRFRETQ